MHGIGSASSWRAEMDPLDQRLTQAGAAWRQAQPESPDLDRMLVALRQPRSGPFQRRLMFAFVAGLLLVAALAIAPAVGSFLHQIEPPAPVVPIVSPVATRSQPPVSPVPTVPSPSVS